MMGKPTKSITIKVCQILPIMVFLSLFNQTQFLAASCSSIVYTYTWDGLSE